MGPADTVFEYSNKAQNISNELQTADHTISEIEMKCALLRNLKSNFMVTTEFIRTVELDYNTVVSNVIIQESPLNESESQKNYALFVKPKMNERFNRVTDKKCYLC